jgi:hypothetical protein
MGQEKTTGTKAYTLIVKDRFYDNLDEIVVHSI